MELVKIEKETIVKNTTEQYKALDGTLFLSKSDCKRHELNIKYKLATINNSHTSTTFYKAQTPAELKNLILLSSCVDNTNELITTINDVVYKNLDTSEFTELSFPVVLTMTDYTSGDYVDRVKYKTLDRFIEDQEALLKATQIMLDKLYQVNIEVATMLGK